MPNTYTELRTVSASSATSVTFNLTGISGYTDLIIVAQAKSSTAGSSVNSYRLRFNNLSTTLYSNTSIQPSGGGTSSTRDVNSSEMYVGLLNQTSLSPETSIIQIMNYSNTNVFKTVLARGASAAASVNGIVGIWRSYSAITQVDLFMTSATITGTFTLYGVANADQGAAKATGGIITEDANYWYHTFGASGAFTPKQSLTADILVVAGGGGGGSGYYDGGGGAGGLQLFTGQSLTTINYQCTVGSGGSVATNLSGTQGNNSQFASLTASVGGGLGRANAVSGQGANAIGGNGGSGGGGGADGNGGGAGAGGSGQSGQGNSGGAGISPGGGNSAGGGGGGRGANGANATSNNGGAGGIGVNTYSSWASVTGTGASGYYAGGGGGGAGNVSGGLGGVAGLGGGGKGGDALVSPSGAGSGISNTGGGGGGATGNTLGGAGGSGVIIVRYAKV